MTAPLRLLFSLDSLNVGGTELNAIRTAEALLERGHTVHMLALHGGGTLRDRWICSGQPLLELDIASLYGGRTLAAAQAVISYIRKHEIHIVHAHDMYSNIFTIACGRLAGCPASIASRRWWSALPQRRYRIGNRIAFKFASRVLANSTSVAADLHASDGVATSRICTVPNFVEPRFFGAASEARRAELRRRLGAGPTDAVLGTVARLNHVKGLDLLLEACAQMRGVGVPFRMAVVGGGPEEARLRTLSSAYGLDEIVHFLGEVPHADHIASLYDVFVLPSRSEGFPNAVIEAMAAGVAVAATRVGGVPDAINDGVTGLLVQPNDASALADALSRLVRDDGLRKRLGSAGHAHALANYGKDSVIDTLIDAYRDVL